ncbi:MAG: prepilin-type N-terminal cleavage/methylation domain-containing protein [Oscillospiraceae bacterium]
MKKWSNLRKNKKGFTLVELLVVLVILAILAAAIIPSMMGFIDQAKNESAAAECRNVLLAANVQLNEDYGAGTAATPLDKTKVMPIAGIPVAQMVGDISIKADGTHFYVSGIKNFKASNNMYYDYTTTGPTAGKWSDGSKTART